MNIKTNNSCIKLADEVNQIISLPTVCFKILELSKDKHSTTRDIETELKKDPGITMQVMRMANSAYFGVRSTIDTLSRAICVIGTKRISKMVLAISAMNSLKQFKNELISMENFWYHSVSSAVIASNLAKHCCHYDYDAVFLGALLHDIGQLILFHKRPMQIQRALKLMHEDSATKQLYNYENEVLGFNHMQLGAAIAERWRLPDNLIECIAYHHVPTSATKFPLNVAIVHIANSLATLTELESNCIDDAPAIHPATWQITNLNPEISIAISHAAKSEYRNTQAALMVA